MQKKTLATPKLRKWVAATVRTYKKRLGVEHYTGFITYESQDEKNTSRGEGFVLNAKIDIDRRYLRFTLYLYPEGMKLFKSDLEEFEALIAHELSHIVTQHLFDVGIATYRDEGEMLDAWESCTEMVARIAMKITE